MKVKKKTNLDSGLPFSVLLPAGVACLLSTWPGKLFMVVAHWALLSWFHVYSSLGRGTCFYAYFLLKKLVSGLLPTGGEGGLHEYSPLGVWLGFLWLLPSGE